MKSFHSYPGWHLRGFFRTSTRFHTPTIFRTSTIFSGIGTGGFFHRIRSRHLSYHQWRNSLASSIRRVNSHDRVHGYLFFSFHFDHGKDHGKDLEKLTQWVSWLLRCVMFLTCLTCFELISAFTLPVGLFERSGFTNERVYDLETIIEFPKLIPLVSLACECGFMHASLLNHVD